LPGQRFLCTGHISQAEIALPWKLFPGRDFSVNDTLPGRDFPARETFPGERSLCQKFFSQAEISLPRALFPGRDLFVCIAFGKQALID
jgi:hypothetical protein